jgi:hypothetical protein
LIRTYLTFLGMARWTRDSWTRDPWTALVAALASYRVTRLITTDHFPPAERFRDWATDQMPDGYEVLWSCPHCVGFWVAAATAATAEAFDRKRKRHWFLLLAMPWAISTVSGVIAEREIN